MFWYLCWKSRQKYWGRKYFFVGFSEGEIIIANVRWLEITTNTIFSKIRHHYFSHEPRTIKVHVMIFCEKNTLQSVHHKNLVYDFRRHVISSTGLKLLLSFETLKLQSPFIVKCSDLLYAPKAFYIKTKYIFSVVSSRQINYFVWKISALDEITLESDSFIPHLLETSGNLI